MKAGGHAACDLTVRFDADECTAGSPYYRGSYCAELPDLVGAGGVANALAFKPAVDTGLSEASRNMRPRLDAGIRGPDA